MFPEYLTKSEENPTSDTKIFGRLFRGLCCCEIIALVCGISLYILLYVQDKSGYNWIYSKGHFIASVAIFAFILKSSHLLFLRRYRWIFVEINQTPFCDQFVRDVMRRMMLLGFFSCVMLLGMYYLFGNSYWFSLRGKIMLAILLAAFVGGIESVNLHFFRRTIKNLSNGFGRELLSLVLFLIGDFILLLLTYLIWVYFLLKPDLT